MTAADLARVDRPAEQLTADMAALVSKQLEREADVVREAMTRTHSPSDRIAYALDARLVTHPEVHLADDDDYAGTPWAAWLADRIASNKQHGGTA